MSDATLAHPGAADYQAIVRAPAFSIGVHCDDDEITAIDYLEPAERGAGAAGQEAVRQLRAYLTDPGFAFGLPLAPAGTPFQRRVWDGIAAIPAGQTRSYGELATASQQPARGRQCLRRQSLSAGRALPSRGRGARRPRRLRPPARRLSARRQTLAAARMKEVSSSRAARRIRRRPLACRRAGEEHAGRLPSRPGAVRRLAGRAQGIDLPTPTRPTSTATSPTCTTAPSGFKPATQRRLHSTLRRFYRWLLDQGRIRVDPLLNIERPLRAERFPKTLSEKNVEDLLAAPDVDTPLRPARPRHAGTALRHRPARLGTGRPEAVRAEPQRRRGARLRQGRQGAAGAARRSRRRLAGALSAGGRPALLKGRHPITSSSPAARAEAA